MDEAQPGLAETVIETTALFTEPDRIGFGAQVYKPQDQRQRELYVLNLESIAGEGGNYEVIPLADGSILLTWWRYKDEAEDD